MTNRETTPPTTQELIEDLRTFALIARDQGRSDRVRLYDTVISRLLAADAMAEALEKCQEYLSLSLGSTSSVDPYADMENALTAWKKATGESGEDGA